MFFFCRNSFSFRENIFSSEVTQFSPQFIVLRLKHLNSCFFTNQFSPPGSIFPFFAFFNFNIGHIFATYSVQSSKVVKAMPCRRYTRSEIDSSPAWLTWWRNHPPPRPVQSLVWSLDLNAIFNSDSDVYSLGDLDTHLFYYCCSYASPKQSFVWHRFFLVFARLSSCSFFYILIFTPLLTFYASDVEP